MNIKILDSHLREFLHTNAKPKDIARALSLTSASIEKIEDFKKDHLYHIEITTNRVDMFSVRGIARESYAVLPQFGFEAELTDKNKSMQGQPTSISTSENSKSIDIQIDQKLVRRISAVIMEVNLHESPQYIKDRLEAAGIRSLNNVIDVTNYVMLTLGHPSHVFDYDRLTTKKLIIRESQKGEKIVTLDKKEYILPGGDIVADNGDGEIVDLLGIMGTANSVVTTDTKRILFFLNNLDPYKVRKTSMTLGIRTEAAGINEKNIDTELMPDALSEGIRLFSSNAEGKMLSKIFDIYPQKWSRKFVQVNTEKIRKIIGTDIPEGEIVKMLSRLDFGVKIRGDILEAAVPSYRNADIAIGEDIAEEIARIFGYHNLPSILPPDIPENLLNLTDKFYWEKKVKNALKYWGFTECYTYSMVSEKLAADSVKSGVKIKNPLDDEHIFMRTTIVPSLLNVVSENITRNDIKIFELANVYLKRGNNLPDEVKTLTAVVKGRNAGFFELKGVIEQLFADLGIEDVNFAESRQHTAEIFVGKKQCGFIELLPGEIVAMEMNFDYLAGLATNKKFYTPVSKFPPFIEDLSLIVDHKYKTGEIINEIKEQDNLIREVTLLDKFENSRTFHIVYQSNEKNLTRDDAASIRARILEALQKKFGASMRE